MNIIKTGYLVTDRRDHSQIRTYAAKNKNGLRDLIEHLTGRDLDSLPLLRGKPYISGILIAENLHIYM